MRSGDGPRSLQMSTDRPRATDLSVLRGVLCGVQGEDLDRAGGGEEGGVKLGTKAWFRGESHNGPRGHLDAALNLFVRGVISAAKVREVAELCRSSACLAGFDLPWDRVQWGAK